MHGWHWHFPLLKGGSGLTERSWQSFVLVQVWAKAEQRHRIIPVRMMKKICERNIFLCFFSVVQKRNKNINYFFKKISLRALLSFGGTLRSKEKSEKEES
jgi:hypothetical protein